MGVKGIKGFNKGLICNKFNGSKQYAENTTYEEDVKPKCCRAGMHMVENPLDAFSYYPPTESEYAEAEALGDIARHDDDSKVATNKLRIGLKVDLKGVIKAGVDFIFEKAKVTEGASATTGEGAHSATTGEGAHSATTGEGANSATTGNYANSATTGYRAHSATTGNYANSATTGYRANSATTGYRAHSATTGNYANSATTGYRANSATTGNYANSAASGKNSIAAALGGESKVKAAKENWIVVSEWKWVDDEYKPVCVRAAHVDGERIKEDTWYKLVDGEFVEAEEA